MFYLPKTDVGISIVLKYSCQGTAEVEVRSGFFDRWAAQLTFPASSCISDAVDWKQRLCACLVFITGIDFSAWRWELHSDTEISFPCKALAFICRMALINNDIDNKKTNCLRHVFKKLAYSAQLDFYINQCGCIWWWYLVFLSCCNVKFIDRPRSAWNF